MTTKAFVYFPKCTLKAHKLRAPIQQVINRATTIATHEMIGSPFTIDPNFGSIAALDVKPVEWSLDTGSWQRSNSINVDSQPNYHSNRV